jgi:hypothetical protein
VNLDKSLVLTERVCGLGQGCVIVELETLLDGTLDGGPLRSSHCGWDRRGHFYGRAYKMGSSQKGSQNRCRVVGSNADGTSWREYFDEMSLRFCYSGTNS